MANLRGLGGFAAPFPSSETVGTSVADPALGSLWTTATGDKVFVVVDCQQALVAGEPVYIDEANLATRFIDANAASARVGVIVAAVSASDTKAYAQIYGMYSGAPGTSNVATCKLLGAATAVCDLAAFSGFNDSDEAAVVIFGAYAVTATDSGATSGYATSFVSASGTSTVQIGFNVWLNYPYTINKPMVASLNDT
jgi:hypothetical protein